MCPDEADAAIVAVIRRLASAPEKARLTTTAMYDMMAENLTKADVCDELCCWIDAGKPLQLSITNKVKEHLGEPAYVIKPRMLGRIFYIKVTVMTPEDVDGGDELLIISAHPSH